VAVVMGAAVLVVPVVGVVRVPCMWWCASPVWTDWRVRRCRPRRRRWRAWGRAARRGRVGVCGGRRGPVGWSRWS